MMPTRAMISNLMPAPVRRRGNGWGDGRPGGRDAGGGRDGGRGGDGGGVRRIYHLSSMPTVFAFSAGTCACLRIALRIRSGWIGARRVCLTPLVGAGAARAKGSRTGAGVGPTRRCRPRG